MVLPGSHRRDGGRPPGHQRGPQELEAGPAAGPREKPRGHNGEKWGQQFFPDRGGHFGTTTVFKQNISPSQHVQWKTPAKWPKKWPSFGKAEGAGTSHKRTRSHTHMYCEHHACLCLSRNHNLGTQTQSLPIKDSYAAGMHTTHAHKHILKFVRHKKINSPPYRLTSLSRGLVHMYKQTYKQTLII